MTVILHNTDRIVTLVVDGKDVPARIWEGYTDTGIQCHAYITRIAVHQDLDSSAFDRELQHKPRPLSKELTDAIPLRLIV